MKIKYLDLFSGIGGFTLGIQQAGVEFEEHYFSEVDKYATQIYKKQFPTAIGLGSVTDVRGKELPKFDLITFGFPCQDLSIAGKRKGLEGSRSGLFGEAIRIINENKPDYFIFENVKGLFSSNEGKDFEFVLRAIADIRYNGEWQMLNTKWFLPQNRERIYFVGYPRTGCRPKIFPIGNRDKKVNKKSEKRTKYLVCNPKLMNYKWSDKSVTLTSSSYKELPVLMQVGTIGKDSEATRVYNPEGIARTIKNGGGMGAKTGLHCVAQRGRGDNNKQTLEARKDNLTNSLTSVQKDNYTMGETLTGKGNNDTMFEKGESDACTQKSNTCKALQTLWEKIGTEAFTKWGLGILNTFQEKKILRKNMYGNSIRPKACKEESTMDDSTLSRSEAMLERELYDLWKIECKRCPPQKPRLAGQFIDELAKGLQKLPQQNTQNSQIRRLTPIEAERLQGFPDNWTAGISDSQRYKCLGNAVSVPVVKAVIERLYENKNQTKRP